MIVFGLNSPQCQFWVLNELIYNWMIYFAIRDRCNRCYLIAAIFRGCAAMVNLFILRLIVNNNISVVKYAT